MEFQNRNLVELVKRTRQRFGVSIQEAHDLIFADQEMRRLVAIRINRDPECRKQAVYDMRQHGEQSRFTHDGERLLFRRRDGQRAKLLTRHSTAKSDAYPHAACR